MSLALAAAAILPLVPIAAGNERLEDEKTFVSEQAEIELARDGETRVLCLDRRRTNSICLTEAEWNKAITLAQNAPKKGPRPFIPQEIRSAPRSTPYSIASTQMGHRPK